MCTGVALLACDFTGALVAAVVDLVDFTFFVPLSLSDNVHEIDLPLWGDHHTCKEIGNRN